MATRLGVAVMAALLALYLGFTLWYALTLLAAAQPTAKAIGAALLALPLVGAWGLLAELLFAFRAGRLLKQLAEEGQLPAAAPRTGTGRADRVEAAARFAGYRAEAERAPESWRAWLRLALAYEAGGDRRRARRAARTAIALHRSTPPEPP